ncbi:MAG: EscU/YscU/HrcU family type III secretion system export apparatus switch protein [Pigmentiphaga sp.]|nr:EscU/YscU/HrcU family type III secretion system export apparatus switch protein [Pigmentiphaga sp.]
MSQPKPPASPSGSETPARQTAVALSYRDGDQAPRVVAKGYGVLAETIQRTAREHGLYVHESPELVGLLMQVDLDSQIPPQLYQAVAELLAWLYRLDALDPEGAAAQANSLATVHHDHNEPGRDPR